MKRLIVITMIVLMVLSGQVFAGSWRGVLGNYPSYGGGIYGGNYGYGLVGIISEVGRIQVANRIIDVAENQQRQRVYVVREAPTLVLAPVQAPAPAPANNQYFEDVRIKGEIQRLKDENQKLKLEIEKLKLELEKIKLQQEIQQRQNQNKHP